MIHPTAIIDENVSIGFGTNIWAFTHISEGASIGENCTIGEGVHIGKNVIIGNNCRIQNHSLIYEGVEIGNDVMISPNVVTTNDIFPQLPVCDWKERFRKTIIEDRVSIGANTTIVCGVTIHSDSMVGAGSVVTKDIQSNELHYGNPAKFARFINKENIWKKKP